MCLEKNKIESCKRIVLWMLKDTFNKANDFRSPTITLDKILESFTIVEKKKRIKEAIDELVDEGKVIKIANYEPTYIINSEVDKNVSI